MNERAAYFKKLWETNEYFDPDTRKAAKAMTDEKEIEECFGSEPDFGTGGLRCAMGVGTAHINRYTIRKITAGLAKYLNRQKNASTVVIAFDSRNHSAEYAKETALTLAAYGIKAMLFSEIAPTPLLSFAVRFYNCDAGVVITASHNPKEDNGYKVYQADGGQAVPAVAGAVKMCIDEIADLTRIIPLSERDAIEKGLFQWLGSETTDAFLDAVLRQKADLPAFARASLSVVYTPLHGTGREVVPRALRAIGYSVVTVSEQEMPDGDFPTVLSPNPEDPAALAMGIRLAEKNRADLVLGTDPDADRVGAAVRCGEEYRLLNGNQIGALLTDFLISQGRNKLGSVLIKTIVTSDLGAEIAREHGIEVLETLTGFKYIGEQISKIEAEGIKRFFFGYEESCGFLSGTHVRDKDATVASLLLCEAAAKAKAEGKTLVDRLEELYRRYGFYCDALDSFTAHGADGREKIQRIMRLLREDNPVAWPAATRIRDYQAGIDGLPPADVLKIILPDSGWIAVRPSGTEPKIKIYYSFKNAGYDVAVQQLTYWQAILRRLFSLKIR